MHALIDQPPGFALDMKRELVVQIAFDPAGGEQRAKPEFQIAESSHGVG
jgi:hypothetical protein